MKIAPTQWKLKPSPQRSFDLHWPSQGTDERFQKRAQLGLLFSSVPPVQPESWRARNDTEEYAPLRNILKSNPYQVAVVVVVVVAVLVVVVAVLVVVVVAVLVVVVMAVMKKQHCYIPVTERKESSTAQLLI